MDFDKAKDVDVVGKVLSDFKKAESSRKVREDIWLECYKLYRSYVEDPKPDGANLFIPYIFSVIETVVPRVVMGLFSSRPCIGILPLRGDMVENAKALENLIDYQLTQKTGILSVATSWLKEACIYGTSILKVGWDFAEEEVITQQPMLEVFGVSLGSIPVKETMVTKDDPYIEHIDLWDIYVDPNGKDIDTAEYCIHRRADVTLEELKKREKEGIYKNIKGVVGAAAVAGEGTSGRDVRLSSVGLQGDSASKDGNVELLEYWTDDRVVTIANRCVVIRNEENPFYHRKKPFVRVVDITVPHEFYGIGEVEVIADTQHELNSLRNARMDNINLIINRMWKVLRGADLDFKQLRSRAGGVIEVDDMDDVQELKVSDVAASAYMEDEKIRKDIDRATGVFDYARGESTDRRETATTAAILSQSADERFKLKISLMEDMGVRRLGQLLVQLNQQFLTSTKAIRVLGQQGMEYIEVEPQDIIGQYDVMPMGSSVEPVVNKQARLDNLINMYNLLKDSPYVNHVQLIKRILEGAEIKDVENIVIDSQQALLQQMFGGMGEEGMAGMGEGMEDRVPVNTSGGAMMNEMR